MNGKWVLDSDGYRVWQPFSVKTMPELFRALGYEVAGKQLKDALMEHKRELRTGKKYVKRSKNRG